MRSRHLPLFWKVCLTNGVVFLVGTLALALSPARVSERVLASEAVVLALGLTLMLVLNALLLRISFAPVERLIREMDKVQELEPGRRLEPPTTAGPGADLVESYNAMLARLEAERSASNAKALAAQEAERHRIAQELHDEVGQTLTAVLLGLKTLESRVSQPVAAELSAIRETARDSLDDVRRVVSRLRPGVLEDLGLHSALSALCTDLSAVSRIQVTRTFGRGLPPLSPEAELVVYRVAQEALTNVARHAQASHVSVSLTRVGDAVVLKIVDDGTARGPLTPGSGIVGMQERALLVGARLEVGTLPAHGVRVRLEITP